MDKGDVKEAVLSAFGVRRIRDLSESQLDELIEKLKAIDAEKNKFKAAEIRKYRHYCLSMMQKIGIDTTDWYAVNDYVLNEKIAGKHLYELSVDELKALHRKLRSIHVKSLVQRKNIKRLTALN